MVCSHLLAMAETLTQENKYWFQFILLKLLFLKKYPFFCLLQCFYSRMSCANCLNET